MIERDATLPEPPPPYRLLRPATRRGGCIFASPHSGRYYPPEFLKQSRLSPLMLRRSEDGFVDELFDHAPEAGAPLLTALYPRAYIDINRAPFELDPTMFDAPLPAYADTVSDRISGGLGTIPRIVGAGLDIYDAPLSIEEAMGRIERIYKPYHQALRRQIELAQAACGYAVVIDCHSMPSIATGRAAGFYQRTPDIVLGDRFGTSCDNAVACAAEEILRGLGLRVARNDPYAGGYTTRCYGQPETGRHSLQIEIARGLYMDESRIEKHNGFNILRNSLKQFANSFIARIGAMQELGQSPDAAPVAAE